MNQPKEVRPPWRDGGLVLVCRKCMRKNGGRVDLRAWLKDRLKREGRRDIRVATTSCLDVCPKRAVTVLIAPAPASASVCLVVDPLNGGEALLARVAATAANAS